MLTKSPLSSIWAEAWAKRASSRSSGGRAIRPGRPATRAMSAASSGPRQPASPALASDPRASMALLLARSRGRGATFAAMTGGMTRAGRQRRRPGGFRSSCRCSTRRAPPPALAREIAAAFAGAAFEIIFVDDASGDGTRAEPRRADAARSRSLRVLGHAPQRRPEPGHPHRRPGRPGADHRHAGRRRPERSRRRARLARALADGPAELALMGGERREAPRSRRPSAGPRAGPTRCAAGC